MFNTRGYSGTSMGDVARESELEKAGIYNHFAGKEDSGACRLRFLHGDHASSFRGGRSRARRGCWRVCSPTAGVLSRIIDDPPVAGGCPMLNTAVEADDANPALKERAAGAAAELLRLFGGLVKEGDSERRA